MVEEINEFAIIFKRIRYEESEIEEFIPDRIVSGYYHEGEQCFVDEDQNVYIHITSPNEVGNVYAYRTKICNAVIADTSSSFEAIKESVFAHFSKFEYYKNIDENSKDYGMIVIKEKETENITFFHDCETPANDEEQSEEEITSEDEEKQVEKLEFNMPVEMINEVKKNIKGQDSALETIITSLWMHKSFPDFPKTHILLIGPQGVGKTSIIQKLASIIDVPSAIVSLNDLGSSQYGGTDIGDMITQLYYESNQDIEKAQHGIIFVDDIDAIMNDYEDDDANIDSIQHELYKFLAGSICQIAIGPTDTLIIDTSNILFVCCGTFEELYKAKETGVGFVRETAKEKTRTIRDKIYENGISQELISTFPIIIELNDVNNDKGIIKDIILNTDKSLFVHMIAALRAQEVEINNLTDVINYIAEEAVSKKLGTNGLTILVGNMFLRIFYEIANNPGKYESITIGKNIITDNSDFILHPKKDKKRTKKVG